jgi:ankyrin
VLPGGHDEAADLLLSRGASSKAKSKNGLTPLHMATQGDHVECIRLLLSAGADINDVSLVIILLHLQT